MANITPNSTIILLHNCPLDTTYDHTIYFTNATDQYNYFSSLAKITRTEYSYVRKDRGLQIEVPVGVNLYDCNYMMFRNASFENKWFYAFVSKVEYVNNITWYIEFELDVMQTWFFDYELEQCFVDREHSATDEIGDNLVPEGLETGDYVAEHFSRCSDYDEDEPSSSTASILEDLSLVFGCTFDSSLADYEGGYYRGLYSGLCYIDFPFPKPATPTNIQSFVTNVRNFINSASAKIDGIVTTFVMPTAFIGSDTSTTVNIGFTKDISYDEIDGYQPKNKKLFTYPYNFMYVNNMQGNTAIYHFEYFSNPDAIGFELEGNYGASPDIMLTPLNYKGSPLQNYDERMIINKYPMLPFANDVYQAWCAMGANAQGIQILGNMASGGLMGGIGAALAVSAGIAPPVAATIGILGAGVAGITSMLSTMYEKDIAPPQSNGNSSGSQALASFRLMDFVFIHKHIRSEFARIIDDYFNVYGYATHRCKVPNRNVRPHWTFTKTKSCCIKGSVPAEDMRNICQIYDRGITFWKNGSEVGDYSLDNRPV